MLQSPLLSFPPVPLFSIPSFLPSFSYSSILSQPATYAKKTMVNPKSTNLLLFFSLVLSGNNCSFHSFWPLITLKKGKKEKPLANVFAHMNHPSAKRLKERSLSSSPSSSFKEKEREGGTFAKGWWGKHVNKDSCCPPTVFLMNWGKLRNTLRRGERERESPFAFVKDKGNHFSARVSILFAFLFLFLSSCFSPFFPLSSRSIFADSSSRKTPSFLAVCGSSLSLSLPLTTLDCF